MRCRAAIGTNWAWVPVNLRKSSAAMSRALPTPAVPIVNLPDRFLGPDDQALEMVGNDFLATTTSGERARCDRRRIALRS